MKRTICNDNGILTIDQPLNSKTLKIVEKEWAKKYGYDIIILDGGLKAYKPKPINPLDSWWIRFKKWGKWVVIALMLAALTVSFEYCRKQFNTQFRKKIAIEMLFMKHRWEHHKDRDLTN